MVDASVAFRSSTPAKPSATLRVLVVTAMFPSPDQPHSGTFIKVQTDSLPAVGVEPTLVVLRGNRFLKYLTGWQRILGAINSSHYDLVHAHYNYCGIIARVQWRLPLVLTFHGGDLLGIHDDMGRQTMLSGPTVLASRLLAHSANGIIVQSQEMLKELRPTPRVPTAVIPMGIDLKIFRPEPRGLARRRLGLDADPDQRYILFVGDPAQGVKAFSVAHASVERLRNDGVRAELLVVFNRPQSDLLDFYNAADVLVLPSFSEGSPNAVKEALACNLPVVAADVGDVRETLERAQEGAVVERTPEAFASAVKRALAIPTGRTNSRERIGFLSMESVAKRVRDIYECALDHARGRTWKVA